MGGKLEVSGAFDRLNFTLNYVLFVLKRGLFEKWLPVSILVELNGSYYGCIKIRQSIKGFRARSLAV